MSAGHPDAVRMRSFSEWLIAHPSDLAEYSAAKLAAAEQLRTAGPDVDVRRVYNTLKEPVVKRILADMAAAAPTVAKPDAAVAASAASSGPTASSSIVSPLHVCVESEWSPLVVCAVNDGSSSADLSMDEWKASVSPEALAEHPETGPLDRAQIMQLARTFHEAMRAHRSSIELLYTVPQQGAFCQIYSRDACFVVGRTLFVASMRDSYRQPEVEGIKHLMERCRLADANSVVDLRSNAGGLPEVTVAVSSEPSAVASVSSSAPRVLIEGGDVLVVSRSLVLVGVGQITNEAGVAALRAALAQRMPDCRVVSVPHTALHLDCCLAPVPDGSALVCEAFFPASSLALLSSLFTSLVSVDATEALLSLAANVFWLDPSTVCCNARTPLTNRWLHQRGYSLIPLDCTQLTNAWGSLRCITCPLIRQSER